MVQVLLHASLDLTPRCCLSRLLCLSTFFFGRNGHPHPSKQHANDLSAECEVMRGRVFSCATRMPPY
ncbi:unnamed protein product [Ectocarpus sp. 12 AP-2014]